MNKPTGILLYDDRPRSRWQRFKDWLFRRSPVISYMYLGDDEDEAPGGVTIVWDASGIFTIKDKDESDG